MIMNDKKGFTLIELIVIITIIAVLVAVTSPQISASFERYQFANSIRSLRSAMVQAKGQAMGNGVQTSLTFRVVNNRINYTAFVDDGNGLGIPGNGIRDGQETLLTNGLLYRRITINQVVTSFPRNLNNDFFIQFNRMGFAMGAPGGFVALFPGSIQFNPLDSSPFETYSINTTVSGSITITKISIPH